MPNNETQVIFKFCRKCGEELSENALFCRKCGTKAAFQDTEPQEQPTAAAAESASSDSVPAPTPSPKKKRLRKALLFSALGAVLTAIAVLAGLYAWQNRVVPRDLQTVNGCPEFYDLTFGINAHAASARVKVKNRVIEGEEEDLVCMEEGEEYNLHGLTVSFAAMTFAEHGFSEGMLVISKDDASYREVVELYTEIYGEPTWTEPYRSVWQGRLTEITVRDSAWQEPDEVYSVLIGYEPAPNAQFTGLRFDGPAHDPCGFLQDDTAFAKPLRDYIDGLEMGTDYEVTALIADGFEAVDLYELYPSFEYMGIQAGMTAVQIAVEDSEITVLRYLYLLEADTAADKMDEIFQQLSAEYGLYDSCTYISLQYDDMEFTDISYAEWQAEIARGTQGMYHIQWICPGQNITLSLSINPDYLYHEGNVSVAETE